MLRPASLVTLCLLALACGDDGGQAAQTDGTEEGTEEGAGPGSSAASTASATGVATQSTTVVSSTAPDASTTGDASGGSASTASEEGSSTGDNLGASACDAYDAYVEALISAADNDARQVLTDAFVAAGQYSDTGFPLRCEGRTIFFSPADGPVFVAGEFNRWDPAADPMAPLVDGFSAWALELALAADTGAYKLVVGNEAFVADPLARRFGWDAFGEFSLVGPSDTRGHHERWPAFSEGIGDLQPRTVTVFVPQQVNANPGAEVAVLYLHDGQNVFSPDALFGGWRASETLAALIDAQTVSPTLLVAIDNTAARMDEYSHVADEIGGGTVGGRAAEYADFLVTGIKPFIDARYPTRTGAASTGVLGSSMGGLVSLILGQRHPDVFGYAGSMSGTLGWGTFGAANETIVQRYADAPPVGLSIYVDSGGNGLCPNEGSDNYCENVAFSEVLREAGWTDEADLFYRWEPGAGHNEAAWAGRLEGAMLDWFPGSLPFDAR